MAALHDLANARTNGSTVTASWRQHHGNPAEERLLRGCGDYQPVAPGYHHPCRLVHRSRIIDIAAITTSTTASCPTWVRSLTITFIP